MKYSTPKGHTNKKMDSAVYAERRQVMDCIYRAKFLLRKHNIQMPRIDIRITSTTPDINACGVAQMRGRYIWIPDSSLKESYLYQVVLHELCHTIWGIGHDKKCLLMHPNVQLNLTDEHAELIFVSYAMEYSYKK
jgi:hypothetical protein